MILGQKYTHLYTNPFICCLTIKWTFKLKAFTNSLCNKILIKRFIISQIITQNIFKSVKKKNYRIQNIRSAPHKRASLIADRKNSIKFTKNHRSLFFGRGREQKLAPD